MFSGFESLKFTVFIPNGGNLNLCKLDRLCESEIYSLHFSVNLRPPDVWRIQKYITKE